MDLFSMYHEIISFIEEFYYHSEQLNFIAILGIYCKEIYFGYAKENGFLLM